MDKYGSAEYIKDMREGIIMLKNFYKKALDYRDLKVYIFTGKC